MSHYPASCYHYLPNRLKLGLEIENTHLFYFFSGHWLDIEHRSYTFDSITKADEFNSLPSVYMYIQAYWENKHRIKDVFCETLEHAHAKLQSAECVCSSILNQVQ